MPVRTNQEHTYKIGNINFIVTTVYQTDRGESMSSILIKLMKTEIDSKQ